MQTMRYLALTLILSLGGSASRRGVLVIGGTGRLGSRVCAGLMQKKIPVRSLQRQLPSVPVPGIEYFAGDVSNITALCEAMRGCDSVICVYKVKPLRFSRLSDIFMSPLSDSTHPYNVNYIGVCNVLHAMKLENVRKIVRTTGGLVSMDEMSLFKATFNLLLSFSVKWNEQSEIAIRASGLDYTILRPTELTDSFPARESNRSLILSQALKSPQPNFLSLDDVADLCIRAAVDEDTMPFATALCSSRAGGDGAQNWTSLLQEVHGDDTELFVPKNHIRGVILLLVITSGAVVLAFKSLLLLLSLVIYADTEFILKCVS